MKYHTIYLTFSIHSIFLFILLFSHCHSENQHRHSLHRIIVYKVGKLLTHTVYNRASVKLQDWNCTCHLRWYGVLNAAQLLHSRVAVVPGRRENQHHQLQLGTDSLPDGLQVGLCAIVVQLVHLSIGDLKETTLHIKQLAAVKFFTFQNTVIEQLSEKQLTQTQCRPIATAITLQKHCPCMCPCTEACARVPQFPLAEQLSSSC